MVIQYSRRRMLAAALLPVVAPAYDIPAPAPVAPPAYSGRWEYNGRKWAMMYVPKGTAPFDAPNCVPCVDGPGYFIMVDLTPTGTPAPEPVVSRAFSVGGYEVRVELRPDGSKSDDPDLIGHVRAENGGLFAIFDATSAERRAAVARYEAGARDDATVNLAFNV